MGTEVSPAGLIHRHGRLGARHSDEIGAMVRKDIDFDAALVTRVTDFCNARLRPPWRAQEV
jgi:hypothetical protein